MKWSEILLRICIYSFFVILFQLLQARSRFIHDKMSSNDYEFKERNVIHVTGFGPFRGFTEKNPSWEVVSCLPDYIEHNKRKIILEKHNVAVTYEAVDAIVPKLWQTKPLVSARHTSAR